MLMTSVLTNVSLSFYTFDAREPGGDRGRGPGPAGDRGRLCGAARGIPARDSRKISSTTLYRDGRGRVSRWGGERERERPRRVYAARGDGRRLSRRCGEERGRPRDGEACRQGRWGRAGECLGEGSGGGGSRGGGGGDRLPQGRVGEMLRAWGCGEGSGKSNPRFPALPCTRGPKGSPHGKRMHPPQSTTPKGKRLRGACCFPVPFPIAMFHMTPTYGGVIPNDPFDPTRASRLE